jgi:hypothetical protein
MRHNAVIYWFNKETRNWDTDSAVFRDKKGAEWWIEFRYSRMNKPGNFKFVIEPVH